MVFCFFLQCSWLNCAHSGMVERSLHSAQVSGQSCSWPLKLMTSQRVAWTWISTGGYGRFRGEWVNKAISELIERGCVKEVLKVYQSSPRCAAVRWKMQAYFGPFVFKQIYLEAVCSVRRYSHCIWFVSVRLFFLHLWSQIWLPSRRNFSRSSPVSGFFLEFWLRC